MATISIRDHSETRVLHMATGTLHQHTDHTTAQTVRALWPITKDSFTASMCRQPQPQCWTDVYKCCSLSIRKRETTFWIFFYCDISCVCLCMSVSARETELVCGRACVCVRVYVCLHVVSHGPNSVTHSVPCQMMMLDIGMSMII